MVGERGGTRGIDDAFLQLLMSGSAPRSGGAGKFGYPGWHETRVEGLVGSPPTHHSTHTCLCPHPSRAPVDRDGGRLDVPLHRRGAGRAAEPAPRPPTARTCASAAVPTTDPQLRCRRLLVDHMHLVVVLILLGPVTPEVAGSSPVAPVSKTSAKHCITLPGQARTAGLNCIVCCPAPLRARKVAQELPANGPSLLLTDHGRSKAAAENRSSFSRLPGVVG